MSTSVDKSAWDSTAAHIRPAVRLRPSSPDAASQRAALSFREKWAAHFSLEANSGSKTLAVVRAGQTLVDMTRQHLGPAVQGLSPAEIYRMALTVGRFNGLKDPNLIKAGQALDFSVLQSRSVIGGANPASSRLPAIASPAPISVPLPNLGSDVVPQSAKRISIVGDSIAVGIGGDLLQSRGLVSDFKPFQKNLSKTGSAYAVDATGGHSSIQIIRDISKNPGVRDADLAIVSVGTNDVVNQPVNSYYSPSQISENLKKIRSSLNANRYVWVLPYDAQARNLVLSVARQFGDSTIDLADFRKADRYHPAAYSPIVRALQPAIQQALSPDRPEPLAPGVFSDGATPWASTASVLRARQSME